MQHSSVKQTVNENEAHSHLVVTQLNAFFGPDQARFIRMSAADVNKIDSKWKRRMEEAMRQWTQRILENAAETGRLALADVDFSDLIMEHSLDAMNIALEHSVEFLPPVPAPSKLGKGRPPRAFVPKNFKQLREIWDYYRKKKYIPQRQRAIAERVKEEYLKRVQEYWLKFGEQFRKGEVADRKRAISEIMRGADVAYSRGKMIVETETTYYYNKTRVAVFNQSPDVTHYLFMAIRDHRTTQWCRDRHGLVYAKDDLLFEEERPPCHWNCRSEVLPLNRHNPRHVSLIEDRSRARRNNSPKPLPPDWSGKRRA